ncbi:hypothetical protein VZT92_022653 [Zoarces viviparus]|uniref:Uncharacterized protein n=1 Tax=Zoarces viviparus TaxID=48416 RepID=A0AAW1ECW0_ZOAVI
MCVSWKQLRTRLCLCPEGIHLALSQCSTPTHPFPIDPPGSRAHSVCQVNQTVKGKLGSAATHAANPSCFSLYPCYGPHGTSLLSMDAY